MNSVLLHAVRLRNGHERRYVREKEVEIGRWLFFCQREYFFVEIDCCFNLFSSVFQITGRSSFQGSLIDRSCESVVRTFPSTS